MAKKKTKKIGKPSRLLYWLIYHFLYPRYRRRYGLTLDTAALKEIKGPALVIAPHTSNKDHWLLGIALYPTRPTFVISEHFMASPKLRPILHLAHVITKKMFCPDVGTIMNILRAAKEGNTIVLFPEGRLTCNGRTGTLTEGSATLAKKLGFDIYVVTANGASLTFPKWAKQPRRGSIRLTAEKLMTAEEVKALPLATIEERMQNAIRHDDAAAMAGVSYRANGMAEGLDGILYRCPSCERELTLRTEGDHIYCTCGMRARLDARYRMHDVPFHTILQWYDWQIGQVDLACDVLETDAILGAVNEKGNMDENAGQAHVRMDRETFTLEGTLFGQPIAVSRRTVDITAFPTTVGKHFDIYHNNKLVYIFPQPDTRIAVKWVAYLDRLVEEEKQKALAKT
ncbi:MAG: 1-acyl-sn-glycerol-3-phosphate acyltransferase [Clostridia bacterium]|nr:1-acyl-sn-glycerol-3-phosphate acyltransferase [Clostridia bacterium]